MRFITVRFILLPQAMALSLVALAACDGVREEITSRSTPPAVEGSGAEAPGAEAPGPDEAPGLAGPSTEPAGNTPQGSETVINEPPDEEVAGFVEPAPETEINAARFRRLALGWSHACALKESGEAVCGGWDWTQEATGDCEPTIDGSFEPPTARFAYVDGEAYGTCGIEQGTQTVKCWGDRYISDAFTELPGALQVTVSVSEACALTVDDQVLCNGPLQVDALSGLGATEIAMGHDHLCALLPDGNISCVYTGSEDLDFGQAEVPAGEYKFLAAGRSTTCAIGLTGELSCCGFNDDGQATPPAGQFTWVDVGPKHGCGILMDGNVVCWGANESGESTPPAGQFTEVAVGHAFSCGLTTDDTVECWGTPTCANTNLPSTL